MEQEPATPKRRDLAELFPNPSPAFDLQLYFADDVPAVHVTNSGGFTHLRSLGGVLPVTVTRPCRTGGMRQSYVTSVSAHLVDYARDEVHLHLRAGFVKFAGLVLVRSVGFLAWLLDADRVAFVNNLLVSTNLYPCDPPFADPVGACRDLVRERADMRALAVVWRSLDERSSPRLLGLLRPHCHVVFSRLVNYLDPADKKIWRRTATMSDSLNFETLSGCGRADVRLVQQGQLTAAQALALARTDAPYEFRVLPRTAPSTEAGLCARLAELYESLYMAKYSRSNPHYDADFFRHVVSHGLWEVCVARRRLDGIVDGFMAVYDVGSGVLTAPAVGYNPDVQVSLYSGLQFWCMLEARSRSVVLNMSGGVAKYKRARGAVPVVEYQAVYCAHLPWWRRAFWALLAWCTCLVAPLIERKARRREI